MVSCKNYLLLVLLAVLLGCTKRQKDILHLSPPSVINGTVTQCENCEIGLEYYDFALLKNIVLKRSRVKQGKFSFVIDADSLPQPGVYGVLLDYKLGDKQRSVHTRIYLPVDSVHLTIDLRGRPNGKNYSYPEASSGFNFVDIHSSSPEQKALDYYLMLRDSMDFKFNNYKKLRTAFFNQAIDSGNKKEIDKWADTLNNFFATGSLYRPRAVDVFIKRYPRSEIVYYALLENYNYISVVPRFRKYFRTLTPEQQNSYYGQILDQRLARYERRYKYAKNFVGAEITYLAGKTPANEKLDAAKIFKQNKFTLVNFWASWCDSCRLRTPVYRQIYQTYRAKGFEIIGVSLDVDPRAWQQAIQQDKMPWYQLSDLKENNGDIVRFRLKGIPANILMNNQGKIEAVDLTPEKLQAKLEQEL